MLDINPVFNPTPLGRTLTVTCLLPLAPQGLCSATRCPASPSQPPAAGVLTENTTASLPAQPHTLSTIWVTPTLPTSWPLAWMWQTLWPLDNRILSYCLTDQTHSQAMCQSPSPASASYLSTPIGLYFWSPGILSSQALPKL